MTPNEAGFVILLAMAWLEIKLFQAIIRRALRRRIRVGYRRRSAIC